MMHVQTNIKKLRAWKCIRA